MGPGLRFPHFLILKLDQGACFSLGTLLLSRTVRFLRGFVIPQKKLVALLFSAFKSSFYRLPSHIRNESPVSPNEEWGLVANKHRGITGMLEKF